MNRMRAVVGIWEGSRSVTATSPIALPRETSDDPAWGEEAPVPSYACQRLLELAAARALWRDDWLPKH
jgi:hypothetical protein